MPRLKSTQIELVFRTWGGKRKGAGRPKEPDAGVPHLRRPSLSRHHPVHVTVRVREHVYNLRAKRCLRIVVRALRASPDRFGMRVVDCSVQGNHIYFLVEAEDRRALARGMKGLCVRVARGLNRLMVRRGAVFADRYHAHFLKTPTEARNALRYVLPNAHRHAERWGRPLPADWTDRYSTTLDRPFLPARTWLLRIGWRGSHAPP